MLLDIPGCSHRREQNWQQVVTEKHNWAAVNKSVVGLKGEPCDENALQGVHSGGNILYTSNHQLLKVNRVTHVVDGCQPFPEPMALFVILSALLVVIWWVDKMIIHECVHNCVYSSSSSAVFYDSGILSLVSHSILSVSIVKLTIKQYWTGPLGD